MISTVSALPITELLARHKAVAVANDLTLRDQVTAHYAGPSHTIFSDSLDTALAVLSSIDALIADPYQRTQESAKQAGKLPACKGRLRDRLRNALPRH